MNPAQYKLTDFYQDDLILKRLEMLRLLRSGESPEAIAVQFHVSPDFLYQLNAAFSLNRVFGILQESALTNWWDPLGKEDAVLRRIEMVRLFRTGTAAALISKAFHTTEEYVERLHNRFLKYGVTGILTEEDFQKFRAINPEVIRIGSYNLHGVQEDNDPVRFRQIAYELSGFDLDLCAFQEVIAGGGIEDTSVQTARWMTEMTGFHYKTHFEECHLFHNKYPEGVSVASRYELTGVYRIDLNYGLQDGLTPHMDRYAVAVVVEVYGRKVVFVSIHLDHHENPQVRLAQAERLESELDRIVGDSVYCRILAGDFNDAENSPVMAFLKAQGYKDCYRACHSEGGNTFPTQNPSTRLDYIMVKAASTSSRVLSAQLVLKNHEMSDHLGVVAVIV